MSLGEINDYIDAKNIADSSKLIIGSWHTINFLNKLFGKDFKNLNNYLPKKQIAVKKYKNKLIDKAMEKARSLGHMI
jgi:ligand-binding sensor domain-containing protein